jgi:hypothetical protein
MLAGCSGLLRLGRQKDHPDRIVFTQFDAQLFSGNGTQETIRLLHQQATAVAGFAISSNTTTVRHACQCLDRLIQQIMAGLSLHVGHQAETTVILELPVAIKTFIHTPTSLKLF